MLSTLKCKAKLSILAFPRKSCPNIRNHYCMGNRLDAQRQIMGFKKVYVNGFIARNSQFTSYIKSISAGVSGIWWFITILGYSTGSFRSLATQASPSEEEKTDEVLNQILSAIQNSPLSSNEICINYIHNLCRARNLPAAARLLQSLRNKRIFLSPHAYNLLLAAAGEDDDIDLLTQIFKDLVAFHGPINSTSYHNLAKAFAKTNDSALLLRFVRDVSELTFPRNSAVVNRIIFAFAQCGQVDKALLIFDHMKSLKNNPDLITYNTVLGILGRAGRVDEMLHEFASMKEADIIPDIISYNTLLSSLRKVGRLDLCLVFLEEMDGRGVEPDLLTYTALIESFGRSGNIEESLRLFDEMKQRRIRPSIYIYRSLISNLKKLGKLELATSFLEDMNRSFSDLIGPKDFKKKNR